MPYDSNGNYSLPLGYFAVNGQTILPLQHNPPLEDIGSALSQTILRSGVAPMLANLRLNGFKITGVANGTDPTDAVNKSQLDGVSASIANNVIPPGSLQAFRRKTAPTGWIIENGGTIGSPTSGATTRANNDCLNLFTLLWGEFSNTELPIKTNTGANSTRGVNAATDWAAGKRMTLFDSRSRFLRGSDSGLGYDPSLIPGVIQADELKAHTHTGATNSAGAHTHSVPQSTVSGGPDTGYQFGPRSGNGPQTGTSGDHTHNFTTASTGGIETRPRASVVLYCIKL